MQDLLTCNTLANGLRAAALTSKGITVVRTRREQFRYSYRELYESALSVLFCLQQAGVKPGGEVVILAVDQLDFLRAFWACLLGGILPVPITAGASREHRRKFFMVWNQLARPHLIAPVTLVKELKVYADETGLISEPALDVEHVTLIDDCSAPQSGVEVEVETDVPAFIQFSSGSTDNSKGVVLSHHNVITNIRAMRRRSRTGNSEQVLLSWLPLTHDMGLIGFHLTPLLSQWDHVLMTPELFQREPMVWLKQISKYRATVTGSPNSGLRHAINHFKPVSPEDLDLSCLRFLLNGGEPISVSLCREFINLLHPYGLSEKALFPVYGLAEASLAVTFPEPEEPFRVVSVCGNQLGPGQVVNDSLENGDRLVSLVEVGSPVDDCFIRIVDADGEPLPENTVGRIQIRGANVTRGYYSRTNSDPGVHRSQWLDTGDLGFLRDGNMIVTGREKEVLFANGQNLYPEDVERVVAEAIGVEIDRVAVARYDLDTLVETAAAFVTHRGSLEHFLTLADKIKDQVARELGLVLHEVVPVRRIPRTTSGKAQRVRLGQELRSGEFDDILHSLRVLKETERGNERDGELDHVTMRVVTIWREVLDDQALGATDNFFARGGNSLKVARAVAAIGDEFGIEVPLRLIFDYPVAQEFAAHLTGESGNRPPAIRPPAIRSPALDYYPLLPEQEALCALQKADPQTTAYNIPLAIRLAGPLHVEQLQRALHLLGRRHSALRTRFIMAEGRLVQRVEESVELTVELEPATPAELNRKLELFVRPFELELAPLFRAKLFRLSETDHVLACDGHHSVLDGLSIVQLLEELAAYYNNDPPAFSAPQFGEYVLRSGAVTHSNKAAVAGVAQESLVVDLPIDFPRPAQRSFAGACVRFALNESQTAALRELAATQGTTLYVVLLSLYFILLARLSGQQEVIAATPYAGRTDELSWQCVGMFVRTILLRLRLPGKFDELLRHVSQEAVSAFNDTGVSRQNGSRELFQHMFVFQDFKLPKLSMSGLAVTAVEFPRTSAKCELCFEAWDEGERISFVLEYCSSLFRPEMVERFAEYYQNLATAVIADPSGAIMDLPIMDRREEQHLLRGLNNTAAEYPRHQTIHGLFEEQVRRTPLAPAVIVASTDHQISYAELDERATALAHVLQANGVRRGTVAGVLLDRSEEMVVAVLAVLKAGGAYLPLAVDLPEKRLALLVRESNAVAIVAKADLSAQLASLKVPVIDPFAYTGTRSDSIALAGETSALDLAYVIYTSGTSGTPKGVMVEHRSVINYLTWARRTYLKGDNLNFALHTSLSFDLTVTSLFTPLISGNAIVVYPPGDPASTLRAIFNDAQVGAVKLTPTHLKLVPDLREPVYARRLIVGGENLETKLAREWASRHPQLEIYNEYGPTEATVGCMIHQFESHLDYGSSIPIGFPADNCQIYLLDPDGRPTPTGARGEIFISGDCLARGYLSNQSSTSAHFTPNPFISSQLMYRSGDLARRLPDGSLEYLGRRDQQTKVRGYRVSLEDIRSAVLSFAGIRDAVVTTELNTNQISEIVVYLVSDAPITRTPLRAFLSRQLPQYLIPNKFFRLPELPVTENGKLDHKALALLASPLESGQQYDAPTGETETRLSEIWEQVLGVERVGRTDNFFDLGGDSIKALMIASRAEEAGLRISVQQVLQTQTLAALANSAGVLLAGGDSRDSEYGAKLLSPIEAWFFEQKFPHPERYCQSVLVRFKERAHVATLRAVLEVVVNHHDALRLNADVTRQRIWFNDQPRDFERALEVLDLTKENDREVQQSIRETRAHIAESFALDNDLLLRAVLLRTQQSDLLLCVAHHLVVDGLSWRILLQDLETVYDAMTRRETPRLPGKTTSVKAWAEQLAAYGQRKQTLAQCDFWRQVFQSSSPGPCAGKWTTSYHELDAEETSSLFHTARTIYKTNPTPLLLTAVLRWLRDALGADTNLVELEHHGRTLVGVDALRTVGWLTVCYPLALRLTASTVSEQVKSIKQQLARVPDDGLGYGVLKYLARCEELQASSRPVARFNYLGEFGAELNGKVFEYPTELWAHAGLVAGVSQDSGFQIDCLLLDGKLRIILGCPSLPKATGRELLSHLRYVIDQAVAQEPLRFSPLDFDVLTLEQRDLDEILT